MKALQVKRTVETYGDAPVQTAGFNMKASAHAFKALSSGLYSNKIGAVVREYSSNAWDAHKMNGNEAKPIAVHLPNSMEPFFSIRDFGPGMSHDDILELFTTYFSSSKSQSNDATGAFGLGSKSAFAYTDQFTVTSRCNGKVNIYNCFIAETGEPAVSLVDESECDVNDSGIEINIAVAGKDFEEFRKQAELNYLYFEVQPKVTGNLYYSVSPPVATHSHKFKNGVEFLQCGLQSPRVVQGAASYPLDYHSLNSALSQFTDEEKSVLQVYKSNILVKFPIGCINVTLSREAIEYDVPTCKMLFDTAQAIADYLKKDTEAKVSVLPNRWEAIKFANKEVNTNPIWNIIKSRVSFKGETIAQLVNGGFNVDLSEQKQAVDVNGKPLFMADTIGNPMLDKVTGLPLPRMETNIFCNIRRATQYSLSGIPKKGIRFDDVRKSFALTPRETQTVVVNTTGEKRFMDKLVHNYDNYRGELFYLTPDDGRVNDVLTELAKVEGFTIITLDSLPDMPKAVLATRYKEKFLLTEVTATSSKGDVKKTLDTGGVYFRTSFGNVREDGFGYGIDELHKLLFQLTQHGVIKNDFKLWGIPASYKEIPTKFDGWVDFKDFLAEKVKKHIDPKFTVEKLNSISEEREALLRHSNELETVRAFKGLLRPFQQIQDFATFLRGKTLDKQLELANIYAKLTKTRVPSAVPSTAPTPARKPSRRVASLIKRVEQRYEYVFKLHRDLSPSNRKYLEELIIYKESNI